MIRSNHRFYAQGCNCERRQWSQCSWTCAYFNALWLFSDVIWWIPWNRKIDLINYGVEMNICILYMLKLWKQSKHERWIFLVIGLRSKAEEKVSFGVPHLRFSLNVRMNLNDVIIWFYWIHPEKHAYSMKYFWCE